MMLNPKIPVTRGGDSSIIGNAKGVRLNTANANTWTGAQSFGTTANFSSVVNLYSTSYNYGSFYNSTNFYNNGTIESAGVINSTGTFTATTVDASTYVKATGGLAPYYDYPYAYSYYLSHAPVTPNSINGNSSVGGFITDDGYGNLYDSIYGYIASIDYTLGLVTDMTGSGVSTNYISYTAASSGYCELDGTGDATITGTLSVGIVKPTSIVDSSTFSSIDPTYRVLYSASISPMLDWFDNNRGLVIFANYGNPVSPVAGSIYFDSSDGHFYGFDGSVWKQLDN